MYFTFFIFKLYYNVHNYYRIGQKNNVTIYYQLFENTISVRMWETLKQKQNIIDTIMNEAGLDEDEIIGNIMNKILDEDE
jgi:SNF2 family DNA or RNA helicase